MTREIPAITPPTFCTECGSRLVETSKDQHHGFDPLTGQPLPATEHVTRTCSTGRPHDTWVLTRAGTPSAAWVKL